MNKQKLQKIVQASGLDSRRKIRALIHEGKFKVNDTVVTDPNFPVDPAVDQIKLENKLIKIDIEERSYFIFNKPNGVISTLDDPEGRPTLKDYIDKIKERVYPVGRLDYHSEGLILLTNDGDLTNFIISARNKVPRQYRIKMKGFLKEEEIDRLLTKGMFVDGARIRPLDLRFTRRTAANNSWYNLTIIEGKKHIIRNMFQYLGHPVGKLQRTAIGTFMLKKLPVGHWRELSDEEVARFKKEYRFNPILS